MQSFTYALKLSQQYYTTASKDKRWFVQPEIPFTMWKLKNS